MGQRRKRIASIRVVVSLCGVALLGLGVAVIGCGESFNVTVAVSPDVPLNEPPEINLFEPNEDLAISQGDSFVIRWTDRDPDSNALITLEMIQTDGGLTVEVASLIPENDNEGVDAFTVNTTDIPFGEFFVRGTIDDGVNLPVSDFASGEQTGNRVRVTITQQGLGRSNRAPRLFVSEPDVNVGVAQNDTLVVVIQPNAGPPPGPVDPGPSGRFDQDGDSVNVAILLDLDLDPTNDNFLVDDDPGNIVLDRRFLPAGSFLAETFDITVDVQEIPVRQDGLPYFVRASATDGLNVRHAYGAGTVHVLEFVEGSARSVVRLVDLAQTGKTLAGATWLGFNPLANLGTKMTTAKDIDNDGVGDMIVIAQFGNPRQRGNLGEAYLIFGTANRRFGGSININSVGTDDPTLTFGRVRGSVFWPHVDVIAGGVVDIAAGDDRRIGFASLDQPYTLGITDVVAIDNLGGGGTAAINACNLPELIFGLPHNEYTGISRDDDLGDDPQGDTGVDPFCYPDDMPNNYATDDTPDPSLNVAYADQLVRFAIEQKMGSVALFYGENCIDGIGDTADTCNTLIAPIPEVLSHSTCGNRWFGTRFGVAQYDNFGAASGGGGRNQQFRIDPLNSHYGFNVGVLGDIDLNGLDEMVISSPRNELESQQLRAEFGDNHPHLLSRPSDANVIVWLGQDFRQINTSEDGNDVTYIPFCSVRGGRPGNCSEPVAPRRIETEYQGLNGAGTAAVNISPGWFRIRGEKPSDKLGFARGAGDFNQDGPTDLLCGGPFADPLLDLDGNGVPDDPQDLAEAFSLDDWSEFDGGTAYIVYLRLPFGNIDLIDANNIFDQPPTVGGQLTRPRMLRIFGESIMDHVGLRQEPASDIDGDLIDDVVIASRDYNGIGLVDNGAVAIVYGGQQVTGDRLFTDIATPRLRGTIFYGTSQGDLAGTDISAGGDFNGDGLGDLLISVPGENRFVIGEDKPRVGTAYLVFGGQHLVDSVFSFSQVGTQAVPGIVFVGPYQEDTPDSTELDQTVFVRSQDCDPFDVSGDLVDTECLCDPEIEELCSTGSEPDGRCCALMEEADGTVAFRRITDARPIRVGFVGDTNGDGFDDIMIGNPRADFFDPRVPVESRRRDAGEIYLIYGNNFGSNTIITGPPDQQF